LPFPNVNEPWLENSRRNPAVISADSSAVDCRIPAPVAIAFVRRAAPFGNLASETGARWVFQSMVVASMGVCAVISRSPAVPSDDRIVMS